jgi:hypothetical protein
MRNRSLVGALILGIGLACGVSAQAPPVKVAPKEFKPSDESFMVRIVGTPKEWTQKAPNGMVTRSWATLTPSGTFSVSWTELSAPPLTEDTAQKTLDGVKGGLLKSSGGKLTSETKIKLADKYPGREISAEAPSKMAFLKLRIFLVDKKLYHVLSMGTKEHVNSPDTTEFLQSFTLLK